MCGRYTLFSKPNHVADQFGTDESRIPSDFSPNYNVAPTHEVPVVFRDQKTQIKILDTMHWGFMGWKPKPGKKTFLPINSRAEYLNQKPMWKKPFCQARCLIPANGFYEWKKNNGGKIPYYIYPNKSEMFAFAGIYSLLSPAGDDSAGSFSIITTQPNSIVMDIHDRMPAILLPSEYEDWVNPDITDTKYLIDFLRPFPDDAIDKHAVSPQVGHVKHNHAGLIQKATLF